RTAVEKEFMRRVSHRENEPGKPRSGCRRRDTNRRRPRSTSRNRDTLRDDPTAAAIFCPRSSHSLPSHAYDADRGTLVTPGGQDAAGRGRLTEGRHTGDALAEIVDVSIDGARPIAD